MHKIAKLATVMLDAKLGTEDLKLRLNVRRRRRQR
ncbi:hypothetical protein M5D96_013336, partial [Drosophila gunungcola]